jgi:hypothetical protein
MCLLLVPAATILGCQPRTTALSPDADALLADVVLPQRIEIQRYLTRPVSMSRAGGDPDGVEVILAALDSSGDPVKSVGSYFFELHEFRPASGDPVGRSLAMWEIRVDSRETLAGYWDRLARFHRFRLGLEGRTLPPGKYVLVARLVLPVGRTLHDQYELAHAPAGAAAGSVP